MCLLGQNIITWLQQQKDGCTSWTKTFRLQSQIGVAIFVSFRQQKPWRQKWIPSPFFVTVSWSMRHYGQADLLSLANFLIVVLESSSWQSLRKRCPYSELFWSVFSRIRTEYEPEELRIRTLFTHWMLSHMKEEIVKIISPNDTFLPANSKLRQIWKFENECFQIEFVHVYYMMLEPRVK